MNHRLQRQRIKFVFHLKCLLNLKLNYQFLLINLMVVISSIKNSKNYAIKFTYVLFNYLITTQYFLRNIIVITFQILHMCSH